MQGNVGFEYRSQDLDNLHFYQTSPVLTVWIFCYLQMFSFFSLRKTKVGILFGYLTAVTLLSTQLTSSSPSSSSAPLKTPSYPRSHEPLLPHGRFHFDHSRPSQQQNPSFFCQSLPFPSQYFTTPHIWLVPVWSGGVCPLPPLYWALGTLLPLLTSPPPPTTTL